MEPSLIPSFIHSSHQRRGTTSDHSSFYSIQVQLLSSTINNVEAESRRSQGGPKCPVHPDLLLLQLLPCSDSSTHTAAAAQGRSQMGAHRLHPPAGGARLRPPQCPCVLPPVSVSASVVIIAVRVSVAVAVVVGVMPLRLGGRRLRGEGWRREGQRLYDSTPCLIHHLHLCGEGGGGG